MKNTVNHHCKYQARHLLLATCYLLLAFCFMGCRTSREAESSTQEAVSTTSAESSQAVSLSVDSLARFCSVELDSFELVIENTPLFCPAYQDSSASSACAITDGVGTRSLYTQRITLRARRAEVSSTENVKQVSSAVISTSDSVSHQSQSACEEKSSRQQTAVVDPPDMTMVITVGLITIVLLAILGGWLWKKLW